MMQGKKKKATENYQRSIIPKLNRIFGKNNVVKEWDVAKDSGDSFTRNLYSPRLDFAIKPFNTDGNVDYNNRKINRAISRYRRLIKRLAESSETYIEGINYFLDNRNRNPRCFLAIEVENSGSRKHMLGDIANASIMGAVGVVIPLNEKQLKGFIKIKNYITFATEVGKLKPSFNNVIVINKNKFLRIVSSYDST